MGRINKRKRQAKLQRSTGADRFGKVIPNIEKDLRQVSSSDATESDEMPLILNESVVEDEVNDFLETMDDLPDNQLVKRFTFADLKWSQFADNELTRGKKAKYTGDSIRTQFRRQKQNAAVMKNQSLITSYFSKPKNDQVSTSEDYDADSETEDSDDMLNIMIEELDKDLGEKFDYWAELDFAIESLDKLTEVHKAKEQVSKAANLSYEYLRAFAVLVYLRKVRDGQARMASSLEIAEQWFSAGKRRARCIRSWASFYLKYNRLPQFTQGLRSRRASLIDEEDVRQECLAFLRSLHVDSRTPTQLQKFLVTSLFPSKFGVLYEKDIEKTISIETCRRWMIILGYSATAYKKGCYVDGHERQDVVEYRQQVFLPKMLEYLSCMDEYDGDNMDAIEPLPNKLVDKVWIVHDESTFYANDAKNLVWLKDGESILRPKSLGASFMASVFLCACHRPTGHQIAIIKPGKNREGYWTNSDLAYQLKNVMPQLHDMHPGKQLVFSFDASQNHNGYQDDALIASKLNKTDGGKNLNCMRDGWFVNSAGVRQCQPMRLHNDEGILVNKGMYTILLERALIESGSQLKRKCLEHLNNSVDCCMLRLLSSQPDFKAQKCMLQEIVDGAKQVYLPFPKFHCELNFIEQYWANVKQSLRSNCSYSAFELEMKLPKTLEDVSLVSIRKYFRRAVRFMHAYSSGLQGRLAEFAVKKYSSHRRLPETICQDIELEVQAKLKAKAAQN